VAWLEVHQVVTDFINVHLFACRLSIQCPLPRITSLSARRSETLWYFTFVSRSGRLGRNFERPKTRS